MSNFVFHPYVRWLLGKSQGDSLGFNIGQDGLALQSPVQRNVDLLTPESEILLPSAVPAGLANFVPEQPQEIPGFHVASPNDVPGFNLNENDALTQERTWPDSTDMPLPGSSGMAQAPTPPPGVEEPDQPASSQPPEWSYNGLGMLVPRSSSAFGPQIDWQIVANEPRLNSTRPYSTFDQNVPVIDPASVYETRGNVPPPDLLSVAALQRWASLATPERPKEFNTKGRPIVEQTKENPWYQSLEEEDQPRKPTRGFSPGDSRRAAGQQLQEQTPFTKEQQIRLTNAAFGKDLAGIQPTPRVDARSVEHSVYNSDTDPGYDALFDLVGVMENKVQGDAAKDAEVGRIEKMYPGSKLVKEIGVFAEGAPSREETYYFVPTAHP